MTNYLNPDHYSKSFANKRLLLLVLSRGSVALGGVLLVGLISSVNSLWNFIHEELAPLAEKNLTTTLNRPVKLGKVKEFSLTGVRFGASAIPATPTDPDRVEVDVVEVGFDPLQLLFYRRLKLDVTLVNPTVHIEQDQQGRWIAISIDPPGQEEPIKTDLDKLWFRNAKVVLVPLSRRAQGAGSPTKDVINRVSTRLVAFSQLNGSAQFLEDNQLIRFDVGGLPSTGGSISLQGEARPKTEEANFLMRVQGLLASDVTRLIDLPVDLQAGRVQGDLKIQLRQQQQASLLGTVGLQSVQVQVPRVPQPFVNSQGNLSFQGNQIKLENVVTGYGKIPLVAKGTIDPKAGFKLAARVNAVSVANAQETLKLKLPVPASGLVKADLQVVGPATQPTLSGTVATIKPAKIDKVDFNNVRAQFEFSPQASVVTLKNIQGQATVGGEVTGSGTIQLSQSPQVDFNLTAKNVPGDAIAGLYATKPPFQIGSVSATAQMSGTAEKVQTIVQWQAPQATYPASGETIIAPDQTVSFRNVALSVAGGTVQANGSWVNQRWQAVADANQIQVERFVNPSQLQNVSLKDARFNGRLILSGTSTPFKIATIRTSKAGVQIAGGTVAVSNIQFSEQSFSTQLVADGVRLGRLLKQVPPALSGLLAGKFQVSASIPNQDLDQRSTDSIPQSDNSRDNFNLKTLRVTGDARLGVGGGTVTASNIQLAEGVYQTQLQANNLNLQELAQLPKQFPGKLTGQFNVAGSIESFQQTIQATGQAQVNVGGGTVTASNIQLANGRIKAQVQANNLPLQHLAPLPPQFHGALTGLFTVAGSVDSFQPQTIQAIGQARLNVAGGTVTAANIQLANGRYQAVVDADGVELNRFSQQLRGQFRGKVQVAGTVETRNFASLQNLRAAGQVQFSQGIAGIEQPLTAVVGWDGEKLKVERATAPGLNASGYIFVDPRFIASGGVPEITELNLNVQVQNYNLQKLPLQLPNTMVAGIADFGGQISGKLPVPNIQGQIRLRDLVVNKLPFEPILNGNIQLVKGQGLNLDFRGTRDIIALNLDANNRPKSFSVQWENALATGQSQGDNMFVKVENFPLPMLNLTLPPNTRFGATKVAGLLTGDVQINQKTFATQGDIAIALPQIGRLKGDRFVAQFRYADGKAIINSSEFVKAKSHYQIAGTLTQTNIGPQLQGKLKVTQGEIQDVLTALQLLELQNLQSGFAEPTYGTAADLSTTNSVGLPNQTLLTQLQRFSEIEALLAQQQQQRRDASPVPDVADLSGTFNGEVSLDTATATGLAVNFNVNGQNFVWGREDEPERLYKAQQVIAQGSFENGVLRLLPLRVESKDGLIAFTGNIGGNEQSGQLRVTNFPLQVLNNFVKLPVGFTGNINATAALAGSIANPQAKGELQITEGTLNQKGVESAIASFSYNKGRLDFGSNVIVSGTEPVNITGSIPYQLPFADATPEKNEISLDVKVKNEGLAVLNLLTNQVAFENGEGEIDLTVRGTIQQPVVNGIATVNNATFSSQALPGQLTNITGKVDFDFDRIVVENLQGKYSQGKVEAKGEIPVSNSQETKIGNPLTVTLDQLALNLKGLYQGGVSGNLEVTGSALNPIVGGQVQLTNGEVLLAESTNGSVPEVSSVDITGLKQTKQDNPDTGNAVTQFNDLQLTLGKNVEVTRSPILNFRATGTLIVNGSLIDPIPEGTIRLRQGGVNLFTTQFNLVRGYKHKATFRKSQPRDPDLDIQLFAKVLDIIQSTADINKPNPTGLAALETIRVEATVKGPASKLDDNLELRSTPTRGETEIVALLGGGFVDTQERGDSTLGLINIAGSAVLNNFQGAFNKIATAFGLSELRLFPTIITDNSEPGRITSSLELAAEAGIDISRRISISSLKILTTSDPIQFGINYRLNNDVRLRTSTNFLDDTRAVVEYQTRF